MADFDKTPLVRDVDDARRIQVALPRTLQITVGNVRQVFPPGDGTGNQLLIMTGAVRFGQDGQRGEEGANENSEYAEVDDGDRRTAFLRLHGPHLNSDQFVGSAAFSALGNIYLQTTGAFGTAVDAAATRFTAPVEDGNTLAQDIWLFADVFAEISNQINRMGYQTFTLLKR
jgi:hypothetical protein